MFNTDSAQFLIAVFESVHIFTDNMMELTEDEKKQVVDLFAQNIGEVMGKLKVKQIDEEVKLAMIEAGVKKEDVTEYLKKGKNDK